MDYDRRAVGLSGRQWKDYMRVRYPQRLSELIAQGRINEKICQVDGRSGEQEVRVDPTAFGTTGYAEDGGYTCKSRAYGEDHQTGGGDCLA